MKKILSCLLTIILISTTICSIFATLPAEFKVSSVNANAGDTVNIDISIIGNPGIASIKLDVEYSTDLILNSIQYNTELGGQSQQPQTLTSPVTLNWINGAADTVGDMTYATLSFTVSATASAGDKPITVTYNPDDVYNTNLDNVPFAVTNGMITVSCSHLNTAQDAGKEPSCTETGFTSGVYCNDCEAWISGHEVIPTVAHDYEWVIDKNATEDETGLKHEECTKCHTKRNESTVIPALGTSEPDDKPEDKPDVNPGCGGPFFIVRLIVKFIKFIFRIH